MPKHHPFDAMIPLSVNGTWATKIPYRGPEWKVHTSKGHASNAVAQRGLREPWAVYELVDKEWILRACNDLGPICPRCNGEYDQAYQAVYNEPPRYGGQNRFFDPQNNGPKYQREIICAVCYQRAQQ